jgi:hypothetical protein
VAHCAFVVPWRAPGAVFTSPVPWYRQTWDSGYKDCDVQSSITFDIIARDRFGNVLGPSQVNAIFKVPRPRNITAPMPELRPAFC